MALLLEWLTLMANQVKFRERDSATDQSQGQCNLDFTAAQSTSPPLIRHGKESVSGSTALKHFCFNRRWLACATPCYHCNRT
jgi:hypothetical protein